MKNWQTNWQPVHRLKIFFRNAKLNLSASGTGIYSDGTASVRDVSVTLDQMLSKLSNAGKKVLITIDEVDSTQNMKQFAAEFQIWIRAGYKVFLLMMMTGLYENIQNLQNEKTLTFLYRAPMLLLAPLNRNLMAGEYARLLPVDNEKAEQMAQLTRGYSYAYQILGYVSYKYASSPEEIIPAFDRFMEERVYEKIWSELSVTDQMVLQSAAQLDTYDVTRIREECSMDPKTFGVYRNRLIRRGILYSPARGRLDFSLPRFREYILSQDDNRE